MNQTLPGKVDSLAAVFNECAMDYSAAAAALADGGAIGFL